MDRKSASIMCSRVVKLPGRAPNSRARGGADPWMASRPGQQRRANETDCGGRISRGSLPRRGWRTRCETRSTAHDHGTQSGRGDAAGMKWKAGFRSGDLDVGMLRGLKRRAGFRSVDLGMGMLQGLKVASFRPGVWVYGSGLGIGLRRLPGGRGGDRFRGLVNVRSGVVQVKRQP